MKKTATRFTLALAFGALAVASAEAAGPRVPQVPIAPTKLQDYFDAVGQAINVYTDQVDIQCWSSTASNNATFTLMVELTAGNAPLNAFGMYNCSPAAPPLYQVFPGAAADGWFAVASFRTAPIRVVVNLFDNNAVIQGTTTYLGADKNNFGFYLQGPGGTFYSQDARNGGNAQAVTYAGTGTSTGQWWLCWEDLALATADYDFEDMIVFLESVNEPVPTKETTWSSLKSRY